MTDKQIIRVGVIGHTGRLGKPLTDILKKHPHVEIVYTESRGEGSSGDLSKSDLVFLALPSGQSAQYLSLLNRKRVIDLSADNRSNPNWIYGSPELNNLRIRDAQLVANPGCYATSIILGLAPLRGLLKNVYVASTSGISGAGMSAQQEDNFLVYNEGRSHPHIAEIEKALQVQEVLFVPQRIDTADKGIVSTIFAEHFSGEDITETYKKFYSQSPFVKLVDKIETKNVNGTNFCNIRPINIGNGKLIVVSTLDNTLKGGAGQAVQNFNIMYGLDETCGLI